MALIIRQETAADGGTVFSVNTAAFGTRTEADLVEILRDQALPAISLVAEFDGRIVGHLIRPARPGSVFDADRADAAVKRRRDTLEAANDRLCFSCHVPSLSFPKT